MNRLDPTTPDGLLGVRIILVELSVVALVCIAALRELDRGMILSAVGVGTFVSADIWTQFVLSRPGHPWSWPAAWQASHLLGPGGHPVHHDVLTGLLNRCALLSDLAQVRPGSSLLTVDLDNFRSVNTLFGHSGGDELLVRAAPRLVDAAGEHSVYRLGGDELAVLVGPEEDRVEALAGRLVTAVRLAALSVPGVGRVSLGASVGCARIGDAGAPLVGLAEFAIAMYVAKTAGRSAVLAGDVAATARRRELVERRLRGGSGPRRDHDPRPMVRLARLGSDQRDLTMGVNLSPVQLRVPGFAEVVQRLLTTYGVLPDRLAVEVTEQVLFV